MLYENDEGWINEMLIEQGLEIRKCNVHAFMDD